MVRREASTVIFEVIDDGPGIPTDEREEVFERFHRGSGSAPGGTGLGLALVKETIVSIGGSVRALEAPGGGVRIRVEVPASRTTDYAGSTRPMPV